MIRMPGSQVCSGRRLLVCPCREPARPERQEALPSAAAGDLAESPKTDSQPFFQFSELSQFADPEALDGRGTWVPLLKGTCTLTTGKQSTFLPAFPRGTRGHLLE